MCSSDLHVRAGGLQECHATAIAMDLTRLALKAYAQGQIGGQQITRILVVDRSHRLHRATDEEDQEKTGTTPQHGRVHGTGGEHAQAVHAL